MIYYLLICNLILKSDKKNRKLIVLIFGSEVVKFKIMKLIIINLYFAEDKHQLPQMLSSHLVNLPSPSTMLPLAWW